MKEGRLQCLGLTLQLCFRAFHFGFPATLAPQAQTQEPAQLITHTFFNLARRLNGSCLDQERTGLCDLG